MFNAYRDEMTDIACDIVKYPSTVVGESVYFVIDGRTRGKLSVARPVGMENDLDSFDHFIVSVISLSGGVIDTVDIMGDDEQTHASVSEQIEQYFDLFTVA